MWFRTRFIRTIFRYYFHLKKIETPKSGFKEPKEGLIHHELKALLESDKEKHEHIQHILSEVAKFS